jgi:hypothetical protein
VVVLVDVTAGRVEVTVEVAVDVTAGGVEVTVEVAVDVTGTRDVEVSYAVLVVVVDPFAT